MNPFDDFEEELTKQVKESATDYDLEVEALIEREQRWKAKRIGKITSSMLPKLLDTNKNGTLKKAGTDYLLEIMHQRQTGFDSEETFAKAMNWGKAHEEEALRYYQAHYEPSMMSATYDFDDIIFVDDVLAGFGDSPDGCTDDHSIICEIKCPYSGAEHLRNCALDAYTENEQYYWQVIGHMIDERVERCDFSSYDPRYTDGHELKMKVLSIHRKDVEADIEKAKVMITLFNELIDKNDVKCILKL